MLLKHNDRVRLDDDRVLTGRHKPRHHMHASHITCVWHERCFANQDLCMHSEIAHMELHLRPRQTRAIVAKSMVIGY